MKTTILIVISLVLLAGTVGRLQTLDSKLYVLTVHTKGADDLVIQIPEHFHTLSTCMETSKLYHSGGYEVNCEVLK